MGGQVKNKHNNDLTRDRILDEAEKLFADHGFDAVSVRQITAQANAHLAAVNYHFGGKQNLYLAVFRERWLPRSRRVVSKLEELEKRGNISLEEAVRTLAEAFLLGFSDDEERMRHHKLIHMEMDHPSEVLGTIFRESTEPAFNIMQRLLSARLPKSISPEKLFMCMLSIFAQVLHFSFGRGMVEHFTGLSYDEKSLEMVTDHIVEFSLSGLTGMGKEA